MLSWPLKQRWFWVLFFVLLTVILLPFLIVQAVLSLNPSSLFLVLIIMIGIWIIVRSYRGWVKRKEKLSEDGASER